MPVRDLAVVASAHAQPFPGYARARRAPLAVDLDRVVACLALLAAMVLPGIVLGRVGSDRRP